MKTFMVVIREIRETCMTVEAESKEQAVESVKELYSNGDIRLTIEDVSDVEID